METLKVRDLVKNDVFSLKDEEKLIVVKEYMRRFGKFNDRATCPINFNTGEVHNNIGLDEDVIRLVRSLDGTDMSEGYDALWYQPYLYGKTMYTLKLKKLLGMDLSDELKMYVVNSFYNDTLPFSPASQEQIVLMLELIISLPEEMQFEAFRTFRNDQISIDFDGNPDSYWLETNPGCSANLFHNRDYREVSRELRKRFCELQNMLSFEEVSKGIDTRVFIPQKVRYAAELVKSVLDSKNNPEVVSSVCEKYRSMELVRKAVFSPSEDRYALLSGYLDLVALDPNFEYDWLQRIADVKEISDAIPYNLKYFHPELLEEKFLVPLSDTLRNNGMSSEQLEYTMCILRELIVQPKASINYGDLELTHYLQKKTCSDSCLGEEERGPVFQKI